MDKSFMKVRKHLFWQSISLINDFMIGPVETLRHLKKDVTEVRKGSECGLNLVDFSDLREGDLVQMFSIIEKPGSL